MTRHSGIQNVWLCELKCVLLRISFTSLRDIIWKKGQTLILTKGMFSMYQGNLQTCTPNPAQSTRVILNYFFCTCRTTGVRGCAPGVLQAWRSWLSVPQLDVLKLACEVPEWVLRYSSDH